MKTPHLLIFPLKCLVIIKIHVTYNHKMIILHNTHLLKLLLNVPKTAARPNFFMKSIAPPPSEIYLRVNILKGVWQ